ncbi:MAG: ArsR family transcriptional regulator [Alicyclobacillus sp.]|nr:ArsR family transcriptional regulator [Alicyclobacillus sp.]
MTQAVDERLRLTSRVAHIHLENFVEIARVLSSEQRINILKKLLKTPMNVAEIADEFELPQSTAAVNIKKMEDCGLVTTELIPGLRGTQKLCSVNIERIVVDFTGPARDEKNYVLIPMPIGQFVDCEVHPTCGLVSETGIIGELDDPSSFYEPEKIAAQLLWFRKGYVEYRFPNRLPKGAIPTSLKLTMEICSEAPMHNPNWPSDITVWINGREVGTWTSPGDFGGERGYLTPHWWENHNTQYGLLKVWRVTTDGSYVDGREVSNLTLNELQIEKQPFISVRIGIKPDAPNQGGLNLFGKRFGNYDTELVMRLDFESGVR